ncbi:type II toxin-antitoxin system VapB family antitoxin [Actinocrinis sp.]|uniref:type II toxin-antitoxin system VapB family antitoxin n=1 Tax=Actinocrinis sp. TaxID=1920516 RepID=UPI002C0AB5BE|nr:type II toxin-antitoxin system VapB family antitoxin [Actinocrinis sp.]HXR69827.1 type II toxin-antitoxin system VapB family antitoxin [Actinocrinis sp.]
MSKTLIDIDDDLLAEAAIALGTGTKKDTVTHALQQAVDEARAKRRAALRELQKMAADGVFDFDKLEELDK